MISALELILIVQKNTPLRVLTQSKPCGRAKGKELLRRKITTNRVRL
jgi:hypothetical protein